MESRNLAEDPDHRNTLETMREPLDRWMCDTNDDPMEDVMCSEEPGE